MLSVSTNKVTLNNKHITVSIDGVCTKFFQSSKKYYMNVKVTEGINNLNILDDMASKSIDNYNSFIRNGIILVKLPFRYGKFEINFKQVNSIDKLDEGSSFTATLQCSGIFTDESGTTLCFIVKELD